MWRCWLGIHYWEQSRPLVLMDLHPGFDAGHKNPTRGCMRCHKRQSWLPGYGGSEIGSWNP